MRESEKSKSNSNEAPKEQTPFQKFQALAKALVGVRAEQVKEQPSDNGWLLLADLFKAKIDFQALCYRDELPNGPESVTLESAVDACLLTHARMQVFPAQIPPNLRPWVIRRALAGIALARTLADSPEDPPFNEGDAIERLMVTGWHEKMKALEE